MYKTQSKRLLSPFLAQEQDLFPETLPQCNHQLNSLNRQNLAPAGPENLRLPAGVFHISKILPSILNNLKSEVKHG